MCIVITCYSGNDVIDFEINLNFPIKPFFPHDKKSQDKFFNILRTKGLSLRLKKVTAKG